MDDATSGPGRQAEEHIAAWRGYLRKHRAIDENDRDELEDHLRSQIAALAEAGLAGDEAFLVAIKRVGALDALTREFAREHSERMWRHLVAGGASAADGGRAGRVEVLAACGLAVAAALSVKVPSLFGVTFTDGNEAFYARNASFFALPFVAAFLAWKRRVAPKKMALAVAPFAAMALAINAYPFAGDSATLPLAALHLPIALWLVAGYCYTGGRWESSARRMDFVRFSGELFIYFVLIALGGGVLTGVTLALFSAIGLNVEWLAQRWLVPCGAAGAVVFAAWLVEAKQSVVENMAPVLTRLFTPLFAAVLLAFLGTAAWAGVGFDVEREALIASDLLLALVLGLLLYAVSARDPRSAPGLFDWLQLTLVWCALLVDAAALAAIGVRISEFGFSPNKAAALGENVVLLVNLAWSAWLYLRFLRGRGPFDALARWQTTYLPVYSAWAAFVVVAFPPLFGFS